MSSILDIVFGKITEPEKGTAIALAEEGPVYSEFASVLDRLTGGAVLRAGEITEYKGKHNSFIDLLAPAGTGLARILIAGTGAHSDEKEFDWAAFGGRIYAKLGKHDQNVTLVADMGEGQNPLSPEHVADMAFGMMLRSYRFDKYKTRDSKKDRKGDKNTGPDKVTILCAEPAKTKKHFAVLKSICEGIYLARDLVNEPSNILGPKEFANRIEKLTELGIEVDILDESVMKKKKMNALLAVGQGSANPTRLAVMKWNGGKKSDTPVAFVGKGVTFDTGGISIKPAQGMEEMKGDMAGAACVTGLMHALASRKAKVNAVGVVGLVENMPGPNAQRPGDVITSMSGKTIEVINTDAEGRLVLADAIWYCQEEFKPSFVINLATLTGAVLVALGNEYAGMFSNNDELAGRLDAVSQKTGEKVWRLPLSSKFDKMINSTIADMKNSAGRNAGSITAAQFLQRFVKKDMPWVHLDIAGTGMASPKTDINTSWGAGFGVHLLNQLVADYYEN